MTCVKLSKQQSAPLAGPVRVTEFSKQSESVDRITDATLPSRRSGRIASVLLKPLALPWLRRKAVDVGRHQRQAVNEVLLEAPVELWDAVRSGSKRAFKAAHVSRAKAVFMGLARGANVQGNHHVLGQAMQHCASMRPADRRMVLKDMWRIFLGGVTGTEDTIIGALRHLWSLPLHGKDGVELDALSKNRLRADVGQALQDCLRGAYVRLDVVGQVRPRTEELFVKHLSDEITNPKRNYPRDPTDSSIPTIDRSLWNDMNRLPMRLVVPGQSDRILKTGPSDADKQAGVATLLDFCDGDPTWLLAVSRLANQGTTSMLMPRPEDDATWPVLLHGEPLLARLAEPKEQSGQTITLTRQGNAIILECTKRLNIASAEGSRAVTCSPDSYVENRARVVIPRPVNGAMLAHLSEPMRPRVQVALQS